MGDIGAVELRIDPRTRAVGSGEVQRLLPFARRRMVGPFIFLDHIGPDTLPSGARIDIDAHPHIGLSTVTYLLDGRMVHRDSTGAVQTIEPGAINWMTAGEGVTHTERSHPDDHDRTRSLHGLQIWVALPDHAESGPASFGHLPAAAVPTERLGDSEIKVAVGSGWGLDSPVPGSSPMVLARLRLDGESAVPLVTELAEIAVVAISGDLRVNDDALIVGQLAVLRADVATTFSGRGELIVLGGDPIGPRYIWWNFVNSDRDRIEQAKQDWETQRFPLVPGDHEPYVPLPS